MAHRFFDLTRDIGRIGTIKEKYVNRRTLYIVAWNWMYQFKRYHHVGKTRLSEWDHWIRFPKYRFLPRVIESYEVEKGIVHLTEGVDSKLFTVNGKKIEVEPS